jgi:exonuclease III/ribonuclease HI
MSFMFAQNNDELEGFDPLPDDNPKKQFNILGNTFSVAMNNVSGLNDTVKQSQVMTLLETYNIDIMGVAETKLKTRTAEFIFKNHPNYLSWFECDDIHPDGSGIGLIIKKDIAQYVQVVKGHKGRVIYADLFMRGKYKLRIIMTYVYANEGQKKETLALYDYLYDIIRQAKRSSSDVIFLGDLNTNSIKLDELVSQGRSIPWKFNLLMKLKSYSFVDTFSLFNDSTIPSWSRNTSKSRIDFIWASDSITADILFSDMFTPSIYSTDHKCVITYFIKDKFFLNDSLAKGRKHGCKVKRFHYSRMNDKLWSEYGEETDNYMVKHHDAFAANSYISSRRMNTMWDSIRTGILAAADLVIPHSFAPGKEKTLKPKSLVSINHHLRFLSQIILKITTKKFLEGRSISHFTWHNFYLNKVLVLCKDLVIDSQNLDTLDFIDDFIHVRNIVRGLFRSTYVLCKIEEDKYKSESMKNYVEKRCDDLLSNQKSMITSILERKKKSIVLDRVIVKRGNIIELITDPDLVNKETILHFQTVAGGINESKQLNDRWQAQYSPKSDIREKWYECIMLPPTMEEWSSVIKSLPLHKATGPSGISNEMLRHVGPIMADAIHQLICVCLRINDIPQQWREATIYPIPKPMDWECDLNKTRPITLLETLRKALVKLVTQRLSKIMSKRKILKGGNHAGLPGGSTFAPLRIINSVIEDAFEKKKELWILFQDLSKAYDRVNLCMLDLAMQRIRFPIALRNFIMNLFSRRKNRIIGYNGLTDEYDVLVGIDQGEVISPLLWCIYYDPLLVEIHEQKQLGYNLEHKWHQDLSVDELSSLSVRLTSQAYMDDTTWIECNKENLEISLAIADEFYALNNIQVNKSKSVLLTSVDTHDESFGTTIVTLRFGSDSISIEPLKYNESTRVLGVWFNLSFKRDFVKSQVSDIISKSCQIMRFKRLTDQQLLYIFNKVVCPQVSYRMQLTVFSANECNRLMAPFRSLLKNKLRISRTAPNFITNCNFIYNINNIYDLQMRSQASFLRQQLNDPGLLGEISAIRWRKLQMDFWLPQSPFVLWPAIKLRRLKSSIIAQTLSLINSEPFNFTGSQIFDNKILGGSIPIIDILNTDYVQPCNINSLRRQGLMYLSQLTTTEGNCLLTWAELSSRPGLVSRRRQPKWFALLEQKVLVASNTRRLKSNWCVGPSVHLNKYTIHPNIMERTKDWVAVWNREANVAVIGHIVHKDIFTGSHITVEHWLHYQDNNLDISPESNPSIIYRCQGCDMNNPRSNVVSTQQYNKIYACSAYYRIEDSVAFSRARRSKDFDLMYEVNPSPREMKQQAQQLFFTPIEISSPADFNDLSHDANKDNILKFIFSDNKRLELWSAKETFKYASALSFYTDGSLSGAGTVNMQMGLGWVQVNSSQSSLTFSASCNNFPSSSRAEILAILSVLTVVPSYCDIDIFTDSAVAIAGFDNLEKFCTSPSTKNQLLWFAIRYIIDSNQLNITTHKVASHTFIPDPFNEQADQLAKDGRFEEEFTMDFHSFLPNSFSLIWEDIIVDFPIRSFIKETCQAKHFDEYLSASRNKKVKKLTQQGSINWTVTKLLIQYHDSPVNSTSFDKSSMKSFKVKCLSEELPTMVILKKRRPDLYNNHSWTCCNCREEEDFSHLWLCDTRRSHINKIVDETIKDIFTQCSHALKKKNAMKNGLNCFQLAKLSCWKFSDLNDIFSLMDLIKGLVPSDLTFLLASWGFCPSITTDILLVTLNLFQIKIRQLWLNRCQRVIDKERSVNISHKQKRGGIKSRSINPLNLTFPICRPLGHVQTIVKQKCDDWHLWCNLSCHFGNTWSDF